MIEIYESDPIEIKRIYKEELSSLEVKESDEEEKVSLLKPVKWLRQKKKEEIRNEIKFKEDVRLSKAFSPKGISGKKVVTFDDADFTRSLGMIKICLDV